MVILNMCSDNLQIQPNVLSCQLPQRGGAVPDPVWVDTKWLLAFPRVPIIMSTPLTQTIFLPCCPLNDRRRAAHSCFKIGRLFFLLFPCLSLARLLIFLLLLMNGNVHPNPGFIFPCSVFSSTRIRCWPCTFVSSYQ